MHCSPLRGLAVCAVGALALTGLSLSTVPTAQAAGPGVTLLSQQTGFASMRIDRDSSFFQPAAEVRLTARLAAPADAVVFQVNIDPEAADGDSGWRDLDVTATTTGSLVSAPWTGTIDNRSLIGERVALRVAATGGGGTSYSTRRNVEVTGAESTVDGVNVATDTTGYFTQPYADAGRTRSAMQVFGGTSATGGTVALTAWRSETGTFGPATAAGVEETSFQVQTIDGDSKIPDSGSVAPGGRWFGAVDITGTSPDDGVVAVSAVRGSDDVAAVSVFAQTITDLSAFPEPTREGEAGALRLRATDQTGRAVIGAEVRRASDESLVGYTGPDGFVATTQAAGATESYYANTTDADAYSETEDVATDPVSVETYTPEARTVLPVVADGPVFDVDEHTAGDIRVEVHDQTGRLLAGQSVSYQLFPTSGEAPTEFTVATSDSTGVVVVPFDTAGASGSYRLVARLTSDADGSGGTGGSVEFVTGQASLVLNPKAAPVVAPAGGQVDYVGRLSIDGEPLAGRAVDIAYRRGIEVVPGNQADAAIATTAGRALRQTVVTNGNGSFRLTVDDLAERPQASETGGVLTAATLATPATDASTVAGNAGARVTSRTQFGPAGPGRARVALGGVNNGRANDLFVVSGPTTVAGELVKVFRLKNGRRVLVASRRLDATGDLTVRVKDVNKRRFTTYVATLAPSPRVVAATSGKRTVR